MQPLYDTEDIIDFIESEEDDLIVHDLNTGGFLSEEQSQAVYLALAALKEAFKKAQIDYYKHNLTEWETPVSA